MFNTITVLRSWTTKSANKKVKKKFAKILYLMRAVVSECAANLIST
jgi:hypothetical protein